MCNDYYFDLVDADFSPLFITFCSYYPYTARVCLKEGRALRTETTINNTHDFGIGRNLKNLPALRAIGTGRRSGGFWRRSRCRWLQRLNRVQLDPLMPCATILSIDHHGRGGNPPRHEYE